MSTTTAAVTTLAVVLAVAGAWCHGYWTRGHLTDRRTAITAEAAARPAGPHPAAVADEIAIGWQQLHEACCLRWWESGGRHDEHDPATCTRKDQTT
ncbi:hypothetical protein [Streptomyces sp. enrichment culture]|uniref:hypothetical protein n=1 Tax=Streptomyces sp. enrichment culture TaxID=1795815 RepID=UPI003F565B0D